MSVDPDRLARAAAAAAAARAGTRPARATSAPITGIERACATAQALRAAQAVKAATNITPAPAASAPVRITEPKAPAKASEDRPAQKSRPAPVGGASASIDTRAINSAAEMDAALAAGAPGWSLRYVTPAAQEAARKRLSGRYRDIVFHADGSWSGSALPIPPK